VSKKTFDDINKSFSFWQWLCALSNYDIDYVMIRLIKVNNESLIKLIVYDAIDDIKSCQIVIDRTYQAISIYKNCALIKSFAR
jgi:hypothetical protein